MQWRWRCFCLIDGCFECDKCICYQITWYVHNFEEKMNAVWSTGGLGPLHRRSSLLSTKFWIPRWCTKNFKQGRTFLNFHSCTVISFMFSMLSNANRFGGSLDPYIESLQWITMPLLAAVGVVIRFGVTQILSLFQTPFRGIFPTQK